MKTEVPSRIFSLGSEETAFERYYDEIQQSLRSLCGMDEFLAGNLRCFN